MAVRGTPHSPFARRPPQTRHGQRPEARTHAPRESQTLTRTDTPYPTRPEPPAGPPRPIRPRGGESVHPAPSVLQSISSGQSGESSQPSEALPELKRAARRFARTRNTPRHRNPHANTQRPTEPSLRGTSATNQSTDPASHGIVGSNPSLESPGAHSSEIPTD
jgi:hypothetical protein